MHEASTGQGSKMKAVVCHRYGSPNVLQIEEVDKPIPTDDRVLVRVKAASVNPLDKYSMRGPWISRITGGGLLRPKLPIQGVDLAGRVEAVGKNVTLFQPGDEVFGTAPGAFAEYASSRKDRLALKPKRITFEQAAGIPIAAVTALQALRDKGQVRPGQKVLIIGASGGVGTFTVQIAKALGAEVTAVCSTWNVDQTRSLGADRVIDYTKEDFVNGGVRYDLVVDNAGTQSFSDCRRLLVPKGTLVLVGADPKRGMTRNLARIASAILMSRFVRQKKMTFLVAKMNKEDLDFLKEMVEAGKVTPVVDKTFPLENAPDAFRYLEEGHARGKVIITVRG
jgi:NADPH:quinone reductase-like Zn-dependent oxidoreductase